MAARQKQEHCKTAERSKLQKKLQRLDPGDLTAQFPDLDGGNSPETARRHCC